MVESVLSGLDTEGDIIEGPSRLLFCVFIQFNKLGIRLQGHETLLKT